MDILHQDDDVIAVAKPAGLLVHVTDMAPDRDVLVSRVREVTGTHASPAHRIDRATSGIVLFGTSAEAVRGLQAALAAPYAYKLYLGITRGVTPEALVMDRPLGRLRPGRASDPRPARTDLRRLAVVAERNSLCLFRPHTGRRHQIRRHLAHAAHQLIGDSRYGKGRINAYFRDTYGLCRLALHAWRVLIRHPATGAPLALEAPLPEDLAGPLARMPEWAAGQVVLPAWEEATGGGW